MITAARSKGVRNGFDPSVLLTEWEANTVSTGRKIMSQASLMYAPPFS
jgi:hypothetical protein